MEAYNDNQVEVAGLLIDTISRTPKYLDTILGTEITLNGARYPCHCSLALSSVLGQSSGGRVKSGLTLLVLRLVKCQTHMIRPRPSWAGPNNNIVDSM